MVQTSDIAVKCQKILYIHIFQFSKLKNDTGSSQDSDQLEYVEKMAYFDRQTDKQDTLVD